MYYLGHRGSHQLRHYQHLDIAGIGVALVRNEVCKFVSCVQKPILCSLHVTGVLRLPQVCKPCSLVMYLVTKRTCILI